ncbi:hypothetical protein RND81_13G016800 [Saponaria officinalis]|uniref:TRF2/HOY1 PH-like domain-containing protein n=1 Tax=Saponaria officinalis TaxID=3572 RepID=A0AAW1GWH6_SAPOF
MSYSNYDGDFQYWTHQYIYDNNNGDESSVANHDDVHNIPTFTSQGFPVIDVEAAVKGENKLGLKLTKTQSLLNIMDGFKTCRGKKKQTEDDSSSSSDKLKASNFPALSLHIGSWKKESRHEGELVAKCYFKKRKLVWEVLNGNLKMKIEFLWSNILGIRQSTSSHESNTSTLEVLLERSPLFFREVNPQPRKHTNWEQTNDFTNNQASLIRKHILEFAPGVLEKHFDKIVHADPKLHRLSQQTWPNHISPYFHEIHFTNSTDFHHPPSHRSFIPTISPQSSNHIQGMDASLMNNSNIYQMQETSFNQNISPYQNHEQGQLSNNVYDNNPQGLPNLYDNQSHYYTSSTNLGNMNQHGYIHEEQQLSYEPNFSYNTTYANSSTQDVGYYQSNDHDYHQSDHYYHDDVGGSQWH